MHIIFIRVLNEFILWFRNLSALCCVRVLGLRPAEGILNLVDVAVGSVFGVRTHLRYGTLTGAGAVHDEAD